MTNKLDVKNGIFNKDYLEYIVQFVNDLLPSTRGMLFWHFRGKLKSIQHPVACDYKSLLKHCELEHIFHDVPYNSEFQLQNPKYFIIRKAGKESAFKLRQQFMMPSSRTAKTHWLGFDLWN